MAYYDEPAKFAVLEVVSSTPKMLQRFVRNWSFPPPTRAPPHTTEYESTMPHFIRYAFAKSSPCSWASFFSRSSAVRIPIAEAKERASVVL
jgi:hypothetical protein